MKIDGDPVLERIRAREEEVFGSRNDNGHTFRTRRYVKDKVKDLEFMSRAWRLWLISTPLGLPARGQRTRTNARTRKGPRRPIR